MQLLLEMIDEFQYIQPTHKHELKAGLNLAKKRMEKYLESLWKANGGINSEAEMQFHAITKILHDGYDVINRLPIQYLPDFNRKVGKVADELARGVDITVEIEMEGGEK